MLTFSVTYGAKELSWYFGCLWSEGNYADIFSDLRSERTILAFWVACGAKGTMLTFSVTYGAKELSWHFGLLVERRELC